MSGHGVSEGARRLTAQRLARVALVAFLEGHSCLRGPTMRFDCASAWCGLRVWCELRDLRLAPGRGKLETRPQSCSLHGISSAKCGLHFWVHVHVWKLDIII
jgi:hypothetical protein